MRRQLLVKVPHIEIKVLLLKQPQHRFHGSQRHALLGHSTTKPISQTIISIFFMATARTPQLATTNPGDLGGLPPRNPPGHRPQNHLLHLHPPLPRGLGTLLHALIADTQPFADSLKANISRLTWADMSCANDSHITIKILDK